MAALSPGNYGACNVMAILMIIDIHWGGMPIVGLGLTRDMWSIPSAVVSSSSRVSDLLLS